MQKQELEAALGKEKMEKVDLDTQLRAKITSLESQVVSLETAKTHEKSRLEDMIVSFMFLIRSHKTWFYGVDLVCYPKKK